MSSVVRPFLAGLASVRAFLAAFVGSLGWFIWAETQQTNGSCYHASHWLPSAAITFGVIIALTIASSHPWRGRPAALLVGRAVAAAAWATFGLFVALYWAGVTGCSG